MNQDRIVSLDAIRGFALFGILIVNMMSFHSPILYEDPQTLWPSGWNRLTYMGIDVFFQASFYPIFSLLFGYSLNLFYERSLERSLQFETMAVRRFIFLLATGFFHAFFIWHGDILGAYALLGLLSLPFLKWPSKLLFTFAVFIYIAGHILFGAYFVWSTVLQADASPGYPHVAAVESIRSYQQGSFQAISEQRMADWFYENNPISLMLQLITIFPLLLAGAALAKNHLLEKETYISLRSKKWMISLFFIGLVIKILPYIYEENRIATYLQDALGGPLLAVSYAFGIVILLKNKHTAKMIVPLSYMGKISMSNYLLQSIVSTLIFYQYGLGLYGKVSMVSGTLLAIALFSLQAAASVFWLNRFSFGPIEWLWRSFTYLQFPKMKKQR